MLGGIDGFDGVDVSVDVHLLAAHPGAEHLDLVNDLVDRDGVDVG